MRWAIISADYGQDYHNRRFDGGRPGKLSHVRAPALRRAARSPRGAGTGPACRWKTAKSSRRPTPDRCWSSRWRENRVIKGRPESGVYKGIPVIIAPVLLEGNVAIAAIGVVDTSGSLDIKAFMDQYSAIEKQVSGHK